MRETIRPLCAAKPLTFLPERFSVMMVLDVALG